MNALVSGQRAPIPEAEPARFVTPHEVARMAGIQPPTVYRYMRKGVLPPPDIRLGASVAWQAERVGPWCEAMASLPEDAADKAKAATARNAAKQVFGGGEVGND